MYHNVNRNDHKKLITHKFKKNNVCFQTISSKCFRT